MKNTIGAIVVVIAGMLPVLTFEQSNSDEPVKTIRISGRLVFPDGNPLSFHNVRMSRMESDGPTDEVTAMADGHGIFTFLVAPDHKYRISLGAGMKTVRVVNAVIGNIDVGDMIFEYCPAVNYTSPKPPVVQPDLIGDLRAEQIVIEPQTLPNGQWTGISGPLLTTAQHESNKIELPQCWTGPSLDRRAEWEALPTVSFDHYLSIESFVGGKVKTIRVVRYDPKLTPIQIEEEVRKVWLGIFCYATANIGWSEGNPWNIEASVEYEDGKRSSILMDGWIHVQVQDREGKYWFIREWPSL